MPSDFDMQMAMLKDPSRWPYWPSLPVKRIADGKGEFGWVTADYPSIITKARLTSPRGIMLQIGVENPGDDLFGDLVPDGYTRAAYEDTVLKRYIDIEQMLDDGWRVD